jgi:hypothetical protein
VKLFVSEGIVLLDSMLDVVRVMLEEMVAVFVIAKHYLFEHLDEVIVGCCVTLLQGFKFGFH